MNSIIVKMKMHLMNVSIHGITALKYVVIIGMTTLEQTVMVMVLVINHIR